QAIDSLPCIEVGGDPGELLILALRLEDRCNRFSWKEKAQILEYIKTTGSLKRIEEISSLISSDHAFFKLTQDFSALNSALKELVEGGLLDLKTAVAVKELPADVCAYFLTHSQSMSFSRKRLFLRHLYEVWRRDGIEAERLYGITETALKSKDPLGSIEDRRYPHLKELEARLNSYKKKILIKTGIELSPPACFEGDAFSVKFSFKSKKQLSRIITDLTAIKETCDEIFCLLY
ncbi:MAG: hypothetical protein AB1798_12975, partial [Spirochaetota bacterium]